MSRQLIIFLPLFFPLAAEQWSGAAYREGIIDRYIAQTDTLDPKSGSITMVQNLLHVVAKK
jgi:hypothetical protein